jgi:hypothetical protein
LRMRICCRSSRQTSAVMPLFGLCKSKQLLMLKDCVLHVPLVIIYTWSAWHRCLVILLPAQWPSNASGWICLRMPCCGAIWSRKYENVHYLLP